MCSICAASLGGLDGAGVPDDRSTRARIRDVALERFAREGIAVTSLRAVARDAEVAPSHVVHYFGSKAGLREACDQFVAATLRRAQEQVLADGAGLTALDAARQTMTGAPVLRYLARTLVEASAASDALVDQLVADGAGYLDRLEQAGTVQPTVDRRNRALLLTFLALGQLALHKQFARLTGVDVTTGEDGSAQQQALAAATLQLLGPGLLTPASIQDFTQQAAASARPAEPSCARCGPPQGEPGVATDSMSSPPDDSPRDASC